MILAKVEKMEIFVPDKPFLSSLIFPRKAGANLSENLSGTLLNGRLRLRKSVNYGRNKFIVQAHGRKMHG
jgi:hypothetical protein